MSNPAEDLKSDYSDVDNEDDQFEQDYSAEDNNTSSPFGTPSFDTAPPSQESSEQNFSSASSSCPSINSDSTSTSEINSSSSSDEDLEELYNNGPLMRHLINGGLSDNDSDSERDNNESQEDTSSSSEEEEDTCVDGKINDSFYQVETLFHRQLGYGSHANNCSTFKRKVYGSLALVQRLELMHKLDKHSGCVNALSFNASGTLLASGSDDQKIVVWDWMRNKAKLSYKSGHHSNVFKSKFLPLSNDCSIVTCSRDGQVRLGELSQTGVCQNTTKLACHDGSAHSLSLVRDSPHKLYSCGEDAVAFAIDIRQSKPIKLVTVKENSKVPLFSIDTHPYKPHEFIVAGQGPHIRVYDKRKIVSHKGTEGCLERLCPEKLKQRGSRHSPYVTCAVYNYDGSEILGSYNDDDIYLFDNKYEITGSHIKRYRGHRNDATVKGVNFFGPKSEFVISGSDGSHIFLWDKETQKVVNYFHGDDEGVVNVLEPHPFDPFLATSGLDHAVKIWSPSAACKTQLEGLEDIMKVNSKNRSEDRRSNPGTDSHIWYMLLQHLRRTSTRNRHGGDTGEDSSSEDLDLDPSTRCVPQ